MWWFERLTDVRLARQVHLRPRGPTAGSAEREEVHRQRSHSQVGGGGGGGPFFLSPPL